MRKIVFIALSLVMISMSVEAQDSQTNHQKELGLIFSSMNSYGLRYKCGNGTSYFRITALLLNGGSSQTDYNNYSSNGIADNNLPQTTASNIGAGLNIGFEIRKSINDKFYFGYGIDLISSYTESKNNNNTPNIIKLNYIDSLNVKRQLLGIENNNSTNNTWSLTTGVGIVLNAGYKISQSFSVCAELLPSASYKYGKTIITNSTYSSTYLYNRSNNPVIVNTVINQTTINKGITYNLANSAASITIAYKF